MYIEQNFVDPAVLDLQANRRMKNRILKYWPRITVGGVEIFGKLYLYNGSVQKSAGHLKLYNLLGVKVEDLESESWQGIENYYLYFKVVQGLEEDLTTVDLERVVVAAMPFTQKSVDTVPEVDRSDWVTMKISYEPLHVETQNSALSNAQIIAAIRSNPQVVTYDSINSDLMAVVALLDTTDSLFEKTFTVDNVQLTDVSHLVKTIKTSKTNITKVVKEAGLTMRFRRKLVDDTIQDSVLGAVTTYINAITTAVTDLDIQAKRLYRTLVPFTDDDIILSQLASIDILTNLHNNIGGSLVGYKVAGLANVPSKTFNKAIVGQITSGYTEESVSWWKKLITVIVTIVIVVVAIWFPPAGWSGLTWAATVLTVGSLAMQGLAIVLAKSDPAWGAYIGKAATVLGYIATAVGIINIVGQLAKSVAAEAGKEAAKEAAKEAGKEVVADTVKEIGKETAKEMTMQEAATIIKGLSFDELSDALVAAMKQSFSTSTSMNMTNVLSWATKGFQIYIKYITPPDKGIDELQEQVDAQEKVREDLTGPGLKDKIDYAFSSPLYGIYECNEIMQGIPHSMTQGKIDICFNKYYDGVTSKVKYRGYLG